MHGRPAGSPDAPAETSTDRRSLAELAQTHPLSRRAHELTRQPSIARPTLEVAGVAELVGHITPVGKNHDAPQPRRAVSPGTPAARMARSGP